MFFLFAALNPYGGQVAAKPLSQWSPPQRIPGYEDDAEPPILIADQNHTIHAFNYQQVGQGEKEIAIIYSQWSPEQGWTRPNDVVLSPLKHEARVMGAYLDPQSTMHLLFYGGDETEANIYYGSAPAARAGQTRAWSAPLAIGEAASSPSSAALTGDGHGNLVAIYSGNLEGNGIYGIYSTDNGVTWSRPSYMYLTYSDVLFPWGLQLAIGPTGMHAIWNVVDMSGQGRTIYYAKFDLAEKSWSDPATLATSESGLGVMHPAIIETDTNIFAVYIVTPKVVMRRSQDGGETWSEPIEPFGRHIGVNGTLSLVTDSAGELHLLWGQRIPGSPDIHGMWHSIWRDNSRWTEPEPVVSGPRVLDTTSDKGFDPFNARAVISQGNVLLVTWRTDPGNIKPNGIWYSYTTLNTPELPVVALAAPPEPTPTTVPATPTPEPSPVSTLNTTAISVTAGGEARAVTPDAPASPLLVGILPVVMLLSAAILFFGMQRRRRL